MSANYWWAEPGIWISNKTGARDTVRISRCTPQQIDLFNSPGFYISDFTPARDIYINTLLSRQLRPTKFRHKKGKLRDGP